MRHGEGTQDNRDFREGLRALRSHRPDLAVALFRASAGACDDGSRRMLGHRLYWLALAELRLDRPELALKTLARARQAEPRGLAAKAYAHRVNSYGMPRRSCPDLDDFYAFYSIQVCVYLSDKPGRRFASEHDKDTVTRLVHFAWQGLKGSGRLAGLSPEDKLRLFREYRGVFPSFVSGTRTLAATGSGASCEAACREPKVLEFRRGRRDLGNS